MFPCHRFVAGVIGRERIPTFERMLWRVCRGNVFLRQADIEDPLEDPTSVSTIWWIKVMFSSLWKSDFSWSFTVNWVENWSVCFQSWLSYVSTGWPGPQVCLHHLLPGRPAEESCQEDLRGVSDFSDCTSFVLFYEMFLSNRSSSVLLHPSSGSEQLCTHVQKRLRRGKRCWQGWMHGLKTCKW